MLEFIGWLVLVAGAAWWTLFTFAFWSFGGLDLSGFFSKYYNKLSKNIRYYAVGLLLICIACWYSVYLAFPFEIVIK